MWELLTRRRLFAEAEDAKQLTLLTHDAEVPTVRTVDPSLDRDLDAIIARATERRMSERIQTAGQLAAYLQMYLDGQLLPFLRPSLPQKSWRWVRRHRKAVAASLAGVLLLGAAAAGVWYWDAYSRPHVAYYARAITRWGLPEGVGRLTAAEDGYVTARFTYDTRGYRTETAYFDEQHRPTLHTDGYTKVLAHYNDKGQLIEQALVGLDGTPVLHKDGYARARRTHNERDKLAQIEFFDLQDRPVVLVYGYATRRFIYGDLGRQRPSLFFDAQGEPVHTRVAVKEVQANRTGAQHGLQAGDILVSYDGAAITDVHTFLNELELMHGERQRTLCLLRQDQERCLTLPPGRLTGLPLIHSVPPTLTKPGL